MQNTMNTYSDLSFVVPDVTASAEEIPKTFIISSANSGSSLQCCPFSAISRERHGPVQKWPCANSHLYRRCRHGAYHILVLMNMYSLNSRVVIFPTSILWCNGNSLHPCRSFFNEPVELRETQHVKVWLFCVSKELASARGLKRGSHSGEHDGLMLPEQPPLNPDAEDEGLLVFVLTGLCRRNVLTQVPLKNPQDLAAISATQGCSIAHGRVRRCTSGGHRYMLETSNLPCFLPREYSQTLQSSSFPPLGTTSSSAASLMKFSHTGCDRASSICGGNQKP